MSERWFPLLSPWFGVYFPPLNPSTKFIIQIFQTNNWSVTYRFNPHHQRQQRLRCHLRLLRCHLPPRPLPPSATPSLRPPLWAPPIRSSQGHLTPPPPRHAPPRRPPPPPPASPLPLPRPRPPTEVRPSQCTMSSAKLPVSSPTRISSYSKPAKRSAWQSRLIFRVTES